MKTRLIVSILVGTILLSTIGYIFIQMSECLYPSPDTNRISYDLNFCLELFVNGYLPYSSEPEPTGGLITTKGSSRMNDITRDYDYTKTRDSGNMQINNKSELVLSEKELDTKLDGLRMAGLPIVSSGIDYDLGVIVIYTPDPTQIDLFRARLGGIPFVLLYEEAPPRWTHDGPEEQKEIPPTTTYYDPARYYEVFTETGPLGLLGVNEKGDVISGSPLLSEVNCMRYATWLTEFQKEKITLSEDYPRYPPWGNEIFPLVDYCLANGDLINTIQDDEIHWEFQFENEK